MPASPKWKQLEQRIARRSGGNLTPGSGAGYIKGDVSTRGMMVESKQTDKTFITILAEWLLKVERESEAVGKVPAIIMKTPSECFACVRLSDLLLYDINAVSVLNAAMYPEDYEYPAQWLLSMPEMDRTYQSFILRGTDEWIFITLQDFDRLQKWADGGKRKTGAESIANSSNDSGGVRFKPTGSSRLRSRSEDTSRSKLCRSVLPGSRKKRSKR